MLWKYYLKYFLILCYVQFIRLALTGRHTIGFEPGSRLRGSDKHFVAYSKNTTKEEISSSIEPATSPPMVSLNL